MRVADYPLKLALPRTVTGQLVAAVLMLSPILFYLTGFRWAIAAVYFIGLGALLLLASPRLAFGLFILSLGFYLRTKVGPMMVLASDVAAFLVTGAVLFEFFLRGRTEIRWSRFDLPLFGLIAATLLSIIFAFNVSYTLVPALRIVVIYLAFRFVFKLSMEVGVRKVTLWYIYFVTALSVYNCYFFIATGGQNRIFGTPWLAFETYSMTALPMALMFLIWSKGRWERLRLTIACLLIAVALIATQSRAPLVAAAITLPALLFFAMRKRRAEGNPIRVARAVQVIFVLALAAGLLLSLEQGLFIAWYERVERLVSSFVSPQGTVALRVVLWTAAVKGFLTNPLTGIGIGNFRIVDQLIPEVKLVPVWYYIGGLSAHNVILQYLVETGIVGALSLIALAWTGVSSAYRVFRAKQDDSEAQVSGALFIAMFVFAVTILYMRAWTWGLDGYILSLIFGLNAAWQWREKIKLPELQQNPKPLADSDE